MAANIPNFPSHAGFGHGGKKDLRGHQPGIPLIPSPSSKWTPNPPQIRPKRTLAPCRSAAHACPRVCTRVLPIPAAYGVLEAEKLFYLEFWGFFNLFS